MILMSVDLPAPLSPIRPSTSPASIFRSTSVSAWMAPKFLEIPRNSNRRTVLLSVGPDDAFFQDQVAVEPAFARGDHRETVVYSLVECKTLDALELCHLWFILAQQRTELVKDRHLAVRTVHHLHVKSRARHEFVERHDGEHGGCNGSRLRTVGANHRPPARQRGIVGIDDRQFVAMPHRTQRGQQFRRQQRIDVLQHRWLLQTFVPSGRLASPSWRPLSKRI